MAEAVQRRKREPYPVVSDLDGVPAGPRSDQPIDLQGLADEMTSAAVRVSSYIRQADELVTWYSGNTLEVVVRTIGESDDPAQTGTPLTEWSPDERQKIIQKVQQHYREAAEAFIQRVGEIAMQIKDALQNSREPEST